MNNWSLITIKPSLARIFRMPRFYSLHKKDNIKTISASYMIVSLYSYLSNDLVRSTGQDLLPRGKGHNRTSRSLTRFPTSPTPSSHTKDSHSSGITLLLYEWCAGSLSSHRIINIQGIVRRDLRLIVLIRED